MGAGVYMTILHNETAIENTMVFSNNYTPHDQTMSSVEGSQLFQIELFSDSNYLNSAFKHCALIRGPTQEWLSQHVFQGPWRIQQTHPIDHIKEKQLNTVLFQMYNTFIKHQQIAEAVSTVHVHSIYRSLETEVPVHFLIQASKEEQALRWLDDSPGWSLIGYRKLVSKIPKKSKRQKLLNLLKHISQF